jgi:hypothetical protein
MKLAAYPSDNIAQERPSMLSFKKQTINKCQRKTGIYVNVSICIDLSKQLLNYYHAKDDYLYNVLTMSNRQMTNLFFVSTK